MNHVFDRLSTRLNMALLLPAPLQQQLSQLPRYPSSPLSERNSISRPMASSNFRSLLLSLLLSLLGLLGLLLLLASTACISPACSRGAAPSAAMVGFSLECRLGAAGRLSGREPRPPWPLLLNLRVHSAAAPGDVGLVGVVPMVMPRLGLAFGLPSHFGLRVEEGLNFGAAVGLLIGLWLAEVGWEGGCLRSPEWLASGWRPS